MSKTFFSQDIFQKNGVFLIGVFLYLFIGLGLTEFYGKDQLHLLINQYHSPFWDQFFKYYTTYSIPVFALISFIIIIKKYDYKMAAYLLSAFLLATVILVFVKRTFFYDGYRPAYYFEKKGISLHYVEGVHRSITYTYPSGHACNAFLFMLFLSMLYNTNKYLQFFFFILAMLVAVSRVYLSKHFVLDTTGGIILGVFANVLMFYIFKNKHQPSLDKKIIP